MTMTKCYFVVLFSLHKIKYFTPPRKSACVLVLYLRTLYYCMMTSEQLDHTRVDSSQSHLQPRTYFPGFKSFGNCK